MDRWPQCDTIGNVATQKRVSEEKDTDVPKRQNTEISQRTSFFYIHLTPKEATDPFQIIMAGK